MKVSLCDLLDSGWLSPNGYSCFGVPEEKPGVYIFAIPIPPYTESEIVYVGSSKNLKKRLLGHEIKKEIKRDFFKTYFFYCEDFISLEKSLIKKYSPRLNIKHNGKRPGFSFLP